MGRRETYICCLCGKEKEGFGNNPYPLVTNVELRCCDYCNMRLVIPARIAQYYNNRERGQVIHMYVTGCYNKEHGWYTMHSPKFPYTSTVYIGYTLDKMKKKYREDHNLKGKHIEWIIV